MKEVIEEAVCGVDGCTIGPTRAAAAKQDKNARPVHQLTIVSDVICPWCFVAKKNLEKALELAGPGLAVAITWRPFELKSRHAQRGHERPRVPFQKIRLLGAIANPRCSGRLRREAGRNHFPP
jgi:hypothetical protein